MTDPGVARKNIRFCRRCDQGGRPDGVQVMLREGHAFIGHMFSDGFSVIDVRDPRDAEAGRLRRRAAEHPLASICKRMTTSCSRSTAPNSGRWSNTR